jgi:hypothetical protein
MLKFIYNIRGGFIFIFFNFFEGKTNTSFMSDSSEHINEIFQQKLML